MIKENFLRIPMHKLYYIDSVDDFNGLSDEELQSMKNEYDADEIEGIVKSVEWAKENPNFDFLSLLPDLKQSNDEIYDYLSKLNDYFLMSRL